MKDLWIVCRVCLQKPSGLQSIFLQDEEDLIKMIAECGGVPIQKFDHYPDKICNKCLKHLRVAYKFRTMCQQSYKYLGRFIAPVKVEFEKAESPDPTNKETSSKIPEPQSECDVTIEIEHGDNEELEMIVETLDMEESVKEDVSGSNHDKDFIMLGNVEVLSDTEYLDEVEGELFNIPCESECLPKEKKEQNQTYAKATKQSRSSEKSSLVNQKYSVKTQKGKRAKQSAFICDICGNIFSTKGRLTEHLNLHKGVKPYSCEICGHAFAQAQQLSRHMNTHTGERPYKCRYCPAAFADISTRNKHHRVHTNERPYVCDVCNKSFAYSNSLKVHRMIHTGEKPHVCDICGKGFAQAYKLRNHKVRHTEREIALKLSLMKYVQAESCEKAEEGESKLLDI